MRGGVLLWHRDMQLYLVRHTRPAIASGICYGQSDLDVAESFTEDLNAVRHKLADISPTLSFSSPLQRCTKLAEQLQLAPLKTDSRLMELDFGDWEMQAWEAIPRQQLDNWSMTYIDTPPPNGESFSALQQRVIEFIHQLQSQHQGQTILIITHAGVIRALLANVLNLALNEVFKFQLDYGSVTQLTFNDTVHNVGYINR